MSKIEIATLGAGCFWCIEAVFQRLQGVHSVKSGYMGGMTENPTYKEICTGMTGHAEVAEIEFDASLLSFSELLEVFWATHDPTTLNRQGNDVGTQYRSAIFYHSDEQKIAAETSMAEASSDFQAAIVTEISAVSTFYPAEEYHDNYYNINPNQPYCRVVVGPKVEKFKEKFKDRLKD